MVSTMSLFLQDSLDAIRTNLKISHLGQLCINLESQNWRVTDWFLSCQGELFYDTGGEPLYFSLRCNCSKIRTNISPQITPSEVSLFIRSRRISLHCEKLPLSPLVCNDFSSAHFLQSKYCHDLLKRKNNNKVFCFALYKILSRETNLLQITITLSYCYIF